MAATTTTPTTPPLVEHKSLAEALAAFQAEAPTFNKSKTAKVETRTGGSYTYRYADLGDIVPVVGPLLAKHGLSWSAKVGSNDSGELVLRYVLRHSSDQEDGDEMPLGVAKGCKPQELGSAITYMRRYAMTAQLNIATEEDDDAQAAQGADRARRQSNGGNGQRTQPVSQTNGGDGAGTSERPASAKQRGMLNAKASEAGLDGATYAGCLLAAAGQPPRTFESDEQAQSFINRQLDRLPARLVDKVLQQIADAEIPF